MERQESDFEQTQLSYEMCRTCGGDGDLLIYSDEGAELQLDEKINAYLPITVTPDDVLPLAMCNTCVERLESCHQIVSSSFEQNERLRSALSHMESECARSDINADYEVDSDSKFNYEKGWKVPADEQIDIEFIKHELCLNDMLEDAVSHESSSDHKTDVLISVSDNVGEYSYLCQVCGKRFKDATVCKCHEKRHKQRPIFACQFCKKVLSNKTTLNVHERTHTGEKPYACRFCEKSFNSKINHDTHIRIHSTVRPYLCEECPATFRTYANLHQHKPTHYREHERPHGCEICGKRFYRKDIKRVHMRTHTGERPYSCRLCGRSFSQRGDMKKHVLIHNKELVTDKCSF